jgi:hypothetical protein
MTAEKCSEVFRVRLPACAAPLTVRLLLLKKFMDVVEMRYFVPWLGGGTMSNRGMGSNPKNGASISNRLLLHKKNLKDVVSNRYFAG